MPSPEQLWRDKYAERFAKTKHEEDTWRELAFVDASCLVCGETLRPLTPHDVVILQGIASPLFYTELELKEEHLAQFMWAQHTDNRGSWLRRAYRRERFLQRQRHGYTFKDRLTAVDDYLREMYVDAPAGRGKDNAETRRPLGVCWIAGLLTTVGEVFGGVDPLTGTPLGQTPLPRLFQYHKAIRARAQGDKFKDYAPSDAIISEWLDELNNPQPVTAS